MLLSGTAGEGPERLRVEEKLQEQDPTCVPSSFISPSLPASNCPFLDQHLPRSHERGLRQPQAGTLRPSSQLAREIAAHSGPAFSNAQGCVLSSPHPRYGTLQQPEEPLLPGPRLPRRPDALSLPRFCVSFRSCALALWLPFGAP